MTAQVEFRFVAEQLATPYFGRGERLRPLVSLGIKPFELLLDLPVAGGYQPLVMTVGDQRLLQCEQVLGPIVSGQGSHNGFLGRLHAYIPQASQHAWVPLPRHNRIQDGHSTQPSDIAEDVVKLDVHLIQRLLHMQNVR
jgi:hypothetical protein